MAQQVCPLCSANIEGDDPHIYKHFKYKRFDCGDKACTSLFYTETERNAHCSETKHKRSFQKTVNPYMEQMIAMIVEDAKELATEDMETVCKNRFEAIKKKKKSDLFKKRVIPTAPPSSESAPGTSGSSATSPSETPSAAKKRNNEEASTSTPATKRTKSGAASSPATSSNNSARRSTDNQPTPSPTSQPTSSAQEVVDSTTTDTTPPVPKQPRKKRDSAAAGNSSKADEDAAALERIAGVGDDYSSDKRELVKVACEQCKQEIPYLYFLRKQHVIVSHLKTISEDDEDHEEICKAEMDRCFPDGPNSKLACQACNDNKDVSANRRREHIEYNHYSILPELKCPLDGCVEVYKRQCDLAGHMKAMHNKMSMSRCKDKKFQESRARRNRMIDELKRRCFPWSEVEENAKMIAKTLQAPEKHASGSLQADIRLAEAGKTRRAPQYQYGSDDSSSDDDDGESTPSVTADADESTTDDQPINQADLEIIEVFFNKAINNQITRPVQVKQEPADDVAEGDVSGGVAPSAPSAPSAPTFRVKQEVVEEEPKQEEISSR
ncbi:hypothetical protein GCK72_008442 [Caenorhabditis remanei]|uniref:C2H2-type domain-containing protein n=1 Tax=Caenorhabditis remanei TaxID=31234 RepID=A0A6A5H0B2_CAERE|nr:hypothetical protein GCK72_008442 [Caenorhabditis remanei]KAF1760196.1 hypothetical protein GCK72_008442 [Caenorhabditis remanei]